MGCKNELVRVSAVMETCVLAVRCDKSMHQMGAPCLKQISYVGLFVLLPCTSSTAEHLSHSYACTG